MSRPIPRFVEYVHRLWLEHHEPAQAVRAAIAASLAWLVAGSLPDPASEYPYYAPFGAVIATTLSLMGSIRESVQAIASIALGGALALLANTTPIPTPFLIALVVAAGVVVSGFRWLGNMGMWVPTAAIFTLIVGKGEAFYIGAYAGLTGLGALIGIAVNLLLPPLPITPARSAMQDFRYAIADELETLADAFDQDAAEREQEAAEHWSVFETRSAMYSTLGLAREAQRGNLRGKKQKHAIDHLSEEATKLDRLSIITNDLRDLLLQEQHLPTDNTQTLQLHGDLFPPLISALRGIAHILHTDGSNAKIAQHSSTENAEKDEHNQVVTAIARLEELQNDLKNEQGKDPLANAIFMTLRRGLDSLQ